MMAKKVYWILVSKDPENTERVRYSELGGVGKLTDDFNTFLLISFVRENNRGWTFERWGLGSSRVELFFSRGEYFKIPDED